jgi:hypothetical protein
MRDKLIRKASVWISCAVVMGCFGYSTLVLSAKPAYASGPICEPEDCTLLSQGGGAAMCVNHHGFQFDICPIKNFPDSFLVRCNDGFEIVGNCSTF